MDEDRIKYLRNNKDALFLLRQSDFLASTFEHSFFCQKVGGIGISRLPQKYRRLIFNVAITFALIALVGVIVGMLGAFHRYSANCTICRLSIQIEDVDRSKGHTRAFNIQS
jgi:hypothetical protein